MRLFEQYVTIACVSNEVGGDLVGNASWTGVHLRDVLDMAGVQPGATQIVGRSVDGFTVGFPTAWAMDPARDPMIAVGMNGEPLPIEHGFPARLIVPGLFGYVSATKWLAEIELTTLEAFDAYWVPLGWSKRGADPDPVADRRARATGARLPPGRSPSPASPGRRTAASRRSRSASTTARGSRPRCPPPISKATWVQWRSTGPRPGRPPDRGPRDRRDGRGPDGRR